MGLEPSMWEVCLEHSEFLADIQELFTKQLEEMKRICKAVLAVGFAMDDLVEHLAWMEEGSRDGNEGAKSIEG